MFFCHIKAIIQNLCQDCNENMVLVQILSVALDNLFIPEEGILPASGKITAPIVMAVHIDEAITLCILAGSGRYQVNGAPCGVAD